VTVDINPVVVSLGPLAVRWFGLLALVGLGVAIWLSLREMSQQRLGRRLALDALAWGLPLAIVCARGVYVLGYWDYYLMHVSELGQLQVDGLSLWGGLAGGTLVGAARLSGNPHQRRRILDVVAPYAALGIAIGQVGAFLDGHGQGLPSQLAWATQYANPLAATPDFGVPRHPAQLYDALIALGLCGVLLGLPRRLPAGTRLAAFGVLYGLARFALGPLLLEPAFLFGLQIEQILALGGVGVGAVFAVWPRLGWSKRTIPDVAAAHAGGEGESLAA
jgi:phosphatidylglycerol:prolipoprotein diacylglycerol transferase